jgi:hypothetical protein
MTKSEWLTCTDPHKMLFRVGGRIGESKLLLFACACARRAWHLVTDEQDRRALEFLERMAHPLAARKRGAGVRALVAVGLALARTQPLGGTYAAGYNTGPSLVTAASDVMVVARVAKAAARARPGRTIKALRIEERRAQRLLRDVAGNPFRRVALNPAWRTRDVLAVARAIYEERAFERMPVLADALEDAGCTDETILTHCRGRGPHARGCWVVDLLLGYG